MCRTQYVLALLALYAGFAHSFSWDFVTAEDRKLEFYFNGRHTHSENITSGKIEGITYDAVGNRMFYSTRNAIFTYDINQKIESLILKNRKEAPKSIVAIAFDPVEELLFWSSMFTNKIYSFSLKPGFENNEYGNLVIHIPNTDTKNIILWALAADSCRGYIYWTSTNVEQNQVPSTIERARFDGSDREILINSNLQMPFHLVLDQQTQKLYWIGSTRLISDPSEDKQFFIETADLNGKNRTILYNETGIDQPMTLDVTKDSIYWMQRFQTVNKLSKTPSIHAKPKQISIRAYFGALATNYQIDDQIQGIQDCEGLKRLVPNNSVTDDNVSLNISSDVSLFCVHGKKVSGKSQCQCTHGYFGERCDVSVCQNYCFQGDCIVSAEEQPTCRCNAGYSGERCQVNDCQGYCLNDGICSLNEESQPVCECKGHYEGERCDVSTHKCFQKLVSMVWGILNADVTQGTLDKGVKSTCASVF